MKFDLATILSVVDGHLFTEIDNIYKILDYMTGESNFTHQLPRLSKECALVILERYPQLVEFKTNEGRIENWKEVLNNAIKKFGNEFEIEPLKNEEFIHIDPFLELEQMVGKDKIQLLFK